MSGNQTGPVIKAILPSASALVIPVPGNMNLPGSITLKSSSGSRLVELSVDGGVEYFTPVMDQATTTMLSVVINAPITHVRLTGDVNDMYLIS